MSYVLSTSLHHNNRFSLSSDHSQLITANALAPLFFFTNYNALPLRSQEAMNNPEYFGGIRPTLIHVHDDLDQVDACLAA